MKTSNIKWLAMVFLLFVIGIIVIADRGMVNQVFPSFKYIPFGDKIGHFVLIGMLSFLVNMSLQMKKVRLYGRGILLGSLMVVVPVIIEEFSQIFVASRSFDLFDLFADFAGIYCFGLLAAYLWEKRLQANDIKYQEESNNNWDVNEVGD